MPAGPIQVKDDLPACAGADGLGKGGEFDFEEGMLTLVAR
jgi:hypothetical protein